MSVLSYILSKSIAKMLFHFVFTSLLVNSLYFLSEGSIKLSPTKPFSPYYDLKPKITLIEDDLNMMRSDLGLIISDQLEIKTDQGHIKEDLKMLELGIKRVEGVLNALMNDVKQIPSVSFPRNCAEALSTSKHSGIYEIQIPWYSEQPFKVPCDANTESGNWTIILRRMDGSVDFNRKWAEYKEGFGNLSGEFFLGLDEIHALTNDQPNELYVQLEDFEGITKYETYDEFIIGDELDWYKIHKLGYANGTAFDSLRVHEEMYFTSQDKDHDHNCVENCAKLCNSGWWYNDCQESHLMGTYNDTSSFKGINWYSWHGYNYSLKRAVMMIRPRNIQDDK